MQLQYSLFGHKQFFILGTEGLKCGSFAMSGVTFNWGNNKRLIVFPVLEITTAICPHPKKKKASVYHCPLPLVQLCMQSHIFDAVVVSVLCKVENPPVVISVFGVVAH